MSGGQMGLFGPLEPAKKAPRKRAAPDYFEPVPPADAGGEWKVHSSDVGRAVAAWIEAHREVWPGENRAMTGRDAGVIKRLVLLYGPAGWRDMARCVCTCWYAIREFYRVRDARPSLLWVMQMRGDVAAATNNGGFRSRSHRGGWNKPSPGKAGGNDGQAPGGSPGGAGFGW